MVLFAVVTNFLNISIHYKTLEPDYQDIVNRNFVTEKKWNAYQSLHKKLDGPLNKEKISYVIDTYQELDGQTSDRTYSTEYNEDTFTGYVFGDYVLFRKEFYEPVKYLVEYQDHINEKVEKAKENMAYYEKYHNTYEYQKNKEIVKRYSNRKLNFFYDTKTWLKLLEYHFSDFLILVLLILGVVPVYSQEKNTGIHQLIQTTKQGKWTFCIGKYIAFILPVVTLVFLFHFMNWLGYRCTFGLSSGSVPLYSIPKYQYTVWNGSIMQFYIFLFVMKCLGFIVLSLIFNLVSEHVSSLVTSYILCVFITIVCTYLSGYVEAIENVHVLLGCISPMTLLKGIESYGTMKGGPLSQHFMIRGNVTICINLLLLSIIAGSRLRKWRKKSEARNNKAF